MSSETTNIKTTNIPFPDKNIIPEKDLILLVRLVSKHGKLWAKSKNLRIYKDEFLYANIEYDQFYQTFKTNQTFGEVKQIISKITRFNPKMMSLGKWSYYDENKKANIFDEVNYNDNEYLYNSCFNQPYTETKYLYIIIDKDKNENHQILNNLTKNMKNLIKKIGN